MKLLLDTHALLWWFRNDNRLGSAARDLISEPSNDVLVSSVSLWEIVVKQRIGKLSADMGKINRAIERDCLDILDILPRHLGALARLPTHHRDPFDHLLIAQAIAEAGGLHLG